MNYPCNNCCSHSTDCQKTCSAYLAYLRQSSVEAEIEQLESKLNKPILTTDNTTLNGTKKELCDQGTNIMGKEIIIKKSLTADSRSCDYSKVTKQQLETATAWHIADVRKGLYYICELLYDRMLNHDKTKDNDAFYKSFISGFKDKSWLKLHYSKERHHLQTPEGVRNDVDLVDVIECVVDCVMAGMARSGKLSPISIPSEVLQKAVENTAEKLKDIIKIDEVEKKQESIKR